MSRWASKWLTNCFYVIRLFWLYLLSSLYYLCHSVDAEKRKNVMYLAKKYSAYFLSQEELTNEPHKARGFMIGYSSIERKSLGNEPDLFIKSTYRHTKQAWTHWLFCLGYNRELLAYQLLNHYNIASVPRLIDYRSNSFSGNYFIVLERVKGAHVRPDHAFRSYPDYPNVAKMMLMEIGRLHALFQKKSFPDFLIPVSNASPISGIAFLKSKFPPLIHAIYAILEQFLNNYPPTMIHGDFRPGNILVSNRFLPADHPDAKANQDKSLTNDQQRSSVHIIDWYHPMRANGMYDYVYFVSMAGNIHSVELFECYCHAAGLDPNDPKILDLLLMTQFEFILVCYFYRKSGIEDTFENHEQDLSHWENMYRRALHELFQQKACWNKFLSLPEKEVSELLQELSFEKKNRLIQKKKEGV